MNKFVATHTQADQVGLTPVRVISVYVVHVYAALRIRLEAYLTLVPAFAPNFQGGGAIGVQHVSIPEKLKVGLFTKVSTEFLTFADGLLALPLSVIVAVGRIASSRIGANKAKVLSAAIHSASPRPSGKFVLAFRAVRNAITFRISTSPAKPLTTASDVHYRAPMNTKNACGFVLRSGLGIGAQYQARIHSFLIRHVVNDSNGAYPASSLNPYTAEV